MHTRIAVFGVQSIALAYGAAASDIGPPLPKLNHPRLAPFSIVSRRSGGSIVRLLCQQLTAGTSPASGWSWLSPRHLKQKPYLAWLVIGLRAQPFPAPPGPPERARRQRLAAEDHPPWPQCSSAVFPQDTVSIPRASPRDNPKGFSQHLNAPVQVLPWQQSLIEGAVGLRE